MNGWGRLVERLTKHLTSGMILLLLYIMDELVYQSSAINYSLCPSILVTLANNAQIKKCN